MPTAPYCTSGDVYLMRHYVEDPGMSDYNLEGPPRKDVVEYWISQIASQIDMAYASVGYEIPLSAISGEDWPAHQTTFLKYFNAIGVASIIGGDASMPPVVQFVNGRRVSRSFYEYEWTRMVEGARGIARYQPSDTLIRAATRVGTAADKLLGDAYAPMTDYLEGYVDPTAMDTLRNFTNRWQGYMEMQTEYNLPSATNRDSIDYLYYLHNRLGLTYDL